MKIVNTLQGIKLKDKLLGYFAIFLIIILAGSLTKSINRAKLVKTEIEKKRQEVAKIEAETEKLKEQVAKTQSVQFVEKEIRNKLGLVKSGETVVFLPEPDVLRSLSPQTPDEGNFTPDPNWKKWMKLFM